MLWVLFRSASPRLLLISTHNIYFHGEIKKKYYLDTFSYLQLCNKCISGGFNKIRLSSKTAEKKKKFGLFCLYFLFVSLITRFFFFSACKVWIFFLTFPTKHMLWCSNEDLYVFHRKKKGRKIYSLSGYPSYSEIHILFNDTSISHHHY